LPGRLIEDVQLSIDDVGHVRDRTPIVRDGRSVGRVQPS
jgi:hypothetical protein